MGGWLRSHLEHARLRPPGHERLAAAMSSVARPDGRKLPSAGSSYTLQGGFWQAHLVRRTRPPGESPAAARRSAFMQTPKPFVASTTIAFTTANASDVHFGSTTSRGASCARCSSGRSCRPASGLWTATTTRGQPVAKGSTSHACERPLRSAPEARRVALNPSEGCTPAIRFLCCAAMVAGLTGPRSRRPPTRRGGRRAVGNAITYQGKLGQERRAVNGNCN